MKTSGRKRYYILYTQERQQTRVKEILENALPPERGEVFCPCMEYYMRGREKPGIKPMFPGYIFMYTDMNSGQVHDFVRSHSASWHSFVRELGFGKKENIQSHEKGTPESDDELSDGDYIISDLSEEETEFLDFLFGIGADGSIKGENQSNEGLLRMSYDYKEGGNYIVMQGPLKHYEDKIVDVNSHDRKAYLDFKIKDCIVKAGFELKPKNIGSLRARRYISWMMDPR